MQYLAKNRTSNVRHLAPKLHGEAIAEMNDSRLFLVLGLWELKLMHNFLSILYFSVFKIVLWFLQQFAQKSRERDGTLLSTYHVVGAGVGAQTLVSSNPPDSLASHSHSDEGAERRSGQAEADGFGRLCVCEIILALVRVTSLAKDTPTPEPGYKPLNQRLSNTTLAPW